MTDFMKFEAAFPELDAFVAEAKALLEKQVAEMVAVGDEAKASVIRGQIGLLGGPTGDLGELAKANAERAKAGALAKTTADLDAEDLVVLRAQAQLLIEMAAARARLQAAGTGALIIPAGTARYSAVGPTAGAQVAVEEQQAAAAAALAAQREAALAASASIVLPAAVTRSYAAGEPNLAQQAASEQQAALAAELSEQQRINNELAVEVAQRARIVALIKEAAAQSAYEQGTVLAASGTAAPKGAMVVPVGLKEGEWTTADAEAQQYSRTLGQFDTYAADASIATEQLTTNTLRLGMVQADASNSLRAHGALTTEYLGALARGETTINEFGYQLGATIGKFGGWAAAAALTYGALGAVVEFGKGAIDAASAVQQLTRTIPGLDKTQASSALQGLAASVNVPIKDAGNAVFLFSRTFHDLADATTAADLALATFKLDGVAVTDSVKSMTAAHQQFGLSAQQLIPIYDEMAQGQQKFNARVTDQVAALLKSSAAVKVAGGNYRDLIELITIAQRTTSQTGSVVGTALARSAANFLSPTTTQGVTDRATLQSLGVNTNQGYTNILFDAIKKAATLTPVQIGELSKAIFGPLRGGLMAGLFTGGPTLLPQVQKELSPAGSKGVLQEELAKELGTASQELKAFLYDLQDLGAAFANTGALKGFGALLGVFAGAVNSVRVLVDEFDKMPSALRSVISGLIELRLLMLFISRTRIGGSIPGISSIPGFRTSPETAARQSIALANRPLITNLESDVGRTAASLGQTAARVTSLQSQLAIVNAEIIKGGEGQAAAITEQVAIEQQIKALTDEQVDLQRTLAYQQEALLTANKRQASVTTSNRLTQMSGADALAQDAAMKLSAGETTATATAVTAEATLAQAQVRADATYATALALQTEATAAVGVASDEDAAALQATANAAAATALAVARAAAAAKEAALAEGTAAVETEASATAIASAGKGILGLAMAMDPLMLALIGLPLAFEALKSITGGADSALAKAYVAAAKPVTTITQFSAHTSALQAVATRLHQEAPWAFAAPQVKPPPPTWQPGTFNTTSEGGRVTREEQAAKIAAERARLAAPARARQAAELAHEKLPAVQARTDTGYLQTIDQITAGLTVDASNMKNTQAGRARWYQQLAAGEAQMRAYIQAHPGVDAGKAYAALADWEQQQYEAVQAQLAKAAPGPNFLSALGSMTDKQIQATGQAYSDRTQAYGLSGGDFTKAAQTGLFSAARYRFSTDPTQLGALSTEGNTLVSDVTRNVTRLQHAAANAPTLAAQNADLGSVVSTIRQSKTTFAAQALSMEHAMAKYPGAVKAIQDFAQQVQMGFDSQLAPAIQATLTAMANANATVVASIAGISPEADLQRSQAVITGSKGLTDQLASAIAQKADPTTIQGLRNQIATANNAQAKNTAAYADSLGQAQDQLASASITGISPEADLARTRADLTAANNQLARDKASGVGGAPKRIADQAAIDTATNKLMQGIQSYDQTLDQSLASFVSAQTDLAASQTTNPVAKAGIELGGALKLLVGIKPSDYKTHQDYETALMTAEANVAKARTAKLDAYVTQQESNDKFLLGTQQISNQEYIARLQKLAKTRNLSLDQLHQIQQEIFDASKSSAVNLNVGNIKLPSTYEVRRAIAAAHHGKQSIGTAVSASISNSNNFVITVTKDADVRKVTDAIGKALGTNTQGVAQAMGMV